MHQSRMVWRNAQDAAAVCRFVGGRVGAYRCFILSLEDDGSDAGDLCGV
jgi:hypothetical protein